MLFPAMTLAMMLAATPALAAEEDTQVWLAQQSFLNLNKDLVLFTDLQVRLTDDAARAGQAIARGALGVRLDPSTTVWGGYGYIRSDPQGGRVSHEHRLFEQVTWRAFGDGAGNGTTRPTLTGRTRLEQRMVEGQQGTGWRLRQLVRLDVPLGKPGSPQAVVWAEPFVGLNRTGWGQKSGFDQLRGFAGLALPVGKGISVEAGYSGQYVSRPARDDRMNHIASLSLMIRR
jgi:hypothetical protein